MKQTGGPLGFTNPNLQNTLKVELDVEARLQAACLKDRIRIKEFFHDFDRLRKGYVAESAVSETLTLQFRTCLGTLQFRFTEEEIQQLLKKYSLGAGLVGYSDFCKHIESVFEPGANEQAVIENSKSQAIFTDQEKELLISTLQELRFNIVTNRIMLKPSFQDFDKARSSHITKDQFFRVLKKLNLFPEQPAVADLLARKYFDKGNLKEINYINFCHDVDKPEDMFPAY